MQKKSKSSILLEKIYTIIGKVVVFAGAFCGMFFASLNILSFLEPYVLNATSFCLAHTQWVMIGVFLIVLSIWGILRLADVIEERKNGLNFEFDEED